MLTQVEKALGFQLPRSQGVCTGTACSHTINRCSSDAIDRTLAVSICELMDAHQIDGFISDPVPSTYVEPHSKGIFHPEIVFCHPSHVLSRNRANPHDYESPESAELPIAAAAAAPPVTEYVNLRKWLGIAPEDSDSRHIKQRKKVSLQSTIVHLPAWHANLIRLLRLSMTSNWKPGRQYLTFAEPVLHTKSLDQYQRARDRRVGCLQNTTAEQCNRGGGGECVWRPTSRPRLQELLMAWPATTSSLENRLRILRAYMIGSGYSPQKIASTESALRGNPTTSARNILQQLPKAPHKALASCELGIDIQTFGQGSMVEVPSDIDLSKRITPEPFTVIGFVDSTQYGAHGVILYYGSPGGSVKNVVLASRPFVFSENKQLGIKLLCGGLTPFRALSYVNKLSEALDKLQSPQVVAMISTAVLQNWDIIDGLYVDGPLGRQVRALPPGLELHGELADISTEMLFTPEVLGTMARLSQIPGSRFQFTGFSLGGALTHMHLFIANVFLRPLFPSVQLSAASFGAPRTGNAVYADMFNNFDHVTVVNGVDAFVPKYDDPSVRSLPATALAKVPFTTTQQFYMYDNFPTLPPASTGFSNVRPTLLADNGRLTDVTDDIRLRSYMEVTERECFAIGSHHLLDTLASQRRGTPKQLGMVGRIAGIAISLAQQLGGVPTTGMQHVSQGLHNYDSYTDSLLGKAYQAWPQATSPLGYSGVWATAAASTKPPPSTNVGFGTVVHTDAPVETPSLWTRLKGLPATIGNVGVSPRPPLEQIQASKELQLMNIRTALEPMNTQQRTEYANDFYKRTSRLLTSVYPELRPIIPVGSNKRKRSGVN